MGKIKGRVRLIRATNERRDAGEIGIALLFL